MAGHLRVPGRGVLLGLHLSGGSQPSGVRSHHRRDHDCAVARAWQLGWFARIGVVGLAVLANRMGWRCACFTRSTPAWMPPSICSETATKVQPLSVTRSTRWSPWGRRCQERQGALPPRSPHVGASIVLWPWITSAAKGCSITDDITSLPQLLNHWRHGGVTHVMYDIGSQASDSSRHNGHPVPRVLAHVRRRAILRGLWFGRHQKSESAELAQ